MLIKWPGSKRRLLPELTRLLPPDFGNYHEPCAGSAALLFAVRQRVQGQPSLIDRNARLIRLYQEVQERPLTLAGEVRLLAEQYLRSDDHDVRATVYYAWREEFNRGANSSREAALFLALNRTAYNGLYRENMAGRLNAPHGRYRRPSFPSAAALYGASQRLEAVILREGDFCLVERYANAGDLVYFDPPYVPTDTSKYIGYTAGGFGTDAHQRMAALVHRLGQRGVYVMISNSDSPLTRQLYVDMNFHPVRTSRPINCKGNGRGPVQELVITNY